MLIIRIQYLNKSHAHAYFINNNIIYKTINLHLAISASTPAIYNIVHARARARVQNTRKDTFATCACKRDRKERKMF